MKIYICLIFLNINDYVNNVNIINNNHENDADGDHIIQDKFTFVHILFACCTQRIEAQRQLTCC